ncbi:anti-repressor SinI family protein [Bacillus sp. FSL K6-3431]|uniref:anti-repressor SinI family protein n=1 Tax=Bacillus sp. FSL K6-3431 TaxID=2921500 RepID=UPI0030F88B80
MNQSTNIRPTACDKSEIPLDQEWITLFLSAKEIGLTVDDIRAFFQKTSQFNLSEH